MSIEDFYEEVGGDYKDIFSRLMNNKELVREFVLMFLKDPSYDELVQQMERKNYEEAFRASHTLKGVCQNLAFTELFKASYDITETLREKNVEKAEELLEKVKVSYAKTIAGVQKLASS